jgi:hypothetical protein
MNKEQGMMKLNEEGTSNDEVDLKKEQGMLTLNDEIFDCARDSSGILPMKICSCAIFAQDLLNPN